MPPVAQQIADWFSTVLRGPLAGLRGADPVLGLALMVLAALVVASVLNRRLRLPRLLLAAITGDRPVDAGAVRIPESVRIAHYRQDLSQVPPDRTLYDIIADLRPSWGRGAVQGHLGRFGFSGDSVRRKARLERNRAVVVVESLSLVDELRRCFHLVDLFAAEVLRLAHVNPQLLWICMLVVDTPDRRGDWFGGDVQTNLDLFRFDRMAWGTVVC